MLHTEEREWKKIYESQLKPGAKREKYVRELIENEFPELECTLGYGAENEEKIPYDPDHKRGAPDQFWHYKGKLLFQIEVTGTDRVVEDYVWIRPDKLYHALKDRLKGITTWFYAVYKNTDYILATELVEKFKDNLWIENPYGRKENYIHVPCDEATFSRNHLFSWIREQLARAKLKLSEPEEKLLNAVEYAVGNHGMTKEEVNLTFRRLAEAEEPRRHGNEWRVG